MMGVTYMADGETVATNDTELRAWILRNRKGDFEEWLDMNIEPMSFNTAYVMPSEVVRGLNPTAYMQEMGYWVDNYVIGMEDALGALDIQIVEVLSPRRVYRIEPVIEPWEVSGDEIYAYDEDADSLDVGDVHTNSAYRVIRTMNRRLRR